MMRNPLLAGAAMMIVAAAVQSIISLVASLLLARWLGPGTFGHFAVVVTAVGLALTVLSLRPSFLMIRVPDDALTVPVREVYATILVAETAVAGAVAVAGLFHMGMLDGLAVMALAGQCLLHWISHIRGFYERSMPYRQLAIMETAATIAGHVITVALVAFGLGAAGLYLRDLVTAVGLIAALWLVRGIHLYRIRWLTASEWRQLWREASVPWIDGILEGAFQRLTVLVVSSLGTARETGLFFIAQSLAMRPHQLLSPVTSRIAGNWFSRASDDRQRIRNRDRLALMSAVPLTVTAAVAIYAADPLVPFLLGSAWDDAAPIVAAMGGAIVFVTLFEIFRAFSLAVRDLPVLVITRIVQYVAFLATIGAGDLLGLGSSIVTGLAVSVAFAAAFVSQCVQLKSSERP